jgi:hypothetical protein
MRSARKKKRKERKDSALVPTAKNRKANTALAISGA